MITDPKLHRLVRAAETLAEREAESATPRKSASTPLEASLAAPIVAYLLEPYDTGYWELRATWNPASALAKYLLAKLGTMADIEKEIDANAFLPAGAARKLSDEKRAELLRVTSRVSSINLLFKAAKVTEDGSDPPKFSEVDSWISRIDLPDLRRTFADAYRIFSEQIYYDGFISAFGHSKPYKIKTGLLALLGAPRDVGALHLIALSRTELIAMADFYRALGVITESQIQRVFAPDEALFRPYFPLVSSVLTHVIRDGQISHVFSQALAYYEDDDFQHCISALGLIAEDYLQRVYTTLLREPLPGGLTLGQTLERLHRRIDDLLPSPKQTLRSADAAYDLIKNLPTPPDAGSLAPVLRELIQLIQDDRQYFGRKIDDVAKPPSRRTVFPAKISDNLNELLKWRNAASHNSRIPLGAHEADRTLFCLVSIITWWQLQLANLDWTKTRTELVEVLLATARQ